MNNKIKKVLVVGGAGYIGGGITDALLEKKIPFAVYDSLLYENHYLKPLDFIYGDVRDVKKLIKIFPDFSHIIWLAAIVGDAACQIRPELTNSINQESVKWLSENFKGKIIFTSTCSVYGEYDKVCYEDSPVNPLSLYAKTKLQAEKYLKSENHLIFRLGTAYGVSDSYSRLRMDLVVNYMTANALTKGKLIVFGGAQWRPLIHVKDIGKIIVNNLESSVQGAYNLATVNLQIKDLAKTISDLIGCKIEHIEQKFEDQRNYSVSVNKAIKNGIFKLEENKNIEYGIKEIADLIQSGRVKHAENNIYFNERHITNLLKNGEFI